MRDLIINHGHILNQKNICELNLANFQGINEIQKQTSKILFRTSSNEKVRDTK